MIGCQINSLDGSVQTTKHIQYSQPQSNVFPLNYCTPSSPISPVPVGAICNQAPHEQYQNMLQMQPPQLSRSKSLNDISNDSQISAFASDRSINLHPNRNNSSQCQQQTNIVHGDSGSNQVNYPYGGEHNDTHQHHTLNPIPNLPTTQCMSIESQHSFNIYPDSQIQQQQTIANQCSNNINNDVITNLQGNTTPAPMYDMCNPMAVNLSGVTEQIGNFHL